MAKALILRVLAGLLFFCVFLAPPLAAWYVFAAHGTPHIVYRYTFYDNGNPYDPLRPRTYITCTYVGLHGSITELADRGQCPWVRLIKRRAG